jgi:hypothetical protein
MNKKDRIRIYNKLKDNIHLQEEIMQKKADEIKSFLQFIMYDFVGDTDMKRDEVTTKKFFTNKDNDVFEHIRKIANELTLEKLTEGL